MMRSFLTGYEAREDRTMHATKVLQKCLGDALGSMHALRSRVLLHAVEAMIQGRRLTLIDLARSWPGAERIRAPLKALDRLQPQSAFRTRTHLQGHDRLVGAQQAAHRRHRLV
jgi:hypothetical protein